MNNDQSSIAELQPTDDEVAAALAAVQAYLIVEQAGTQPTLTHRDAGWQQAAKLSVQEVRPRRTATPPRWQTIERLRRTTGGGYGIVGL